jgi:site-specific DNA recombinase
MNNLDQFKQFAKQSKKLFTQMSNNVVIYTRVSTKEQADNNKSLDTQKKYCEDYAIKNNFYVAGYFGGTYESAQNDERKEFKRMLEFLKHSKEKIGHIIVYSVDRFSRSGANAIFIAEELRKNGIKILAVTQPADTSTAEGVLQQNIQFVFSQYDNDQRRKKTITGMTEKLRNGGWCGKAPVGYDHFTINGVTQIKVNEKGKLIRKAFLMKANEGLRNIEIVKKCKALGLNICEKRLKEIFRNPFYCGVMSHNLLNGEVVKGKHEQLISEEIFFKVNELTAKHPQGYKVKNFNEDLPLKVFMKCADCKKPMTGYLNRRKNIHYYKCNNIGCRCNVNAKYLHRLFEELMAVFKWENRFIEPLKTQLKLTFKYMNKENEANRTDLQTRLKEVESKINKVEERFVLGEIERPLYERHIGNFKREKDIINQELQTAVLNLSNIDKYVDFAVSISGNLNKIWCSGGYQLKQKIQYLVFPEGILYNKKENHYLTLRVNSAFLAMSDISRTLDEKESGQNECNFNLSACVPGIGVEPIRV